MFKKIPLISMALISLFLLSACNDKNDSDSATANSYVSFFHNIQGKGLLQLKAVNTSQRNSYGTADFEQFSSTISLPVGQWGLSVEETQSTGASSTVQLVEGRFPVTAKTTNIVAMTVDPANPGSYLIHTLKEAKSSGTRVINVSHLQSAANVAVDVYVIPATETSVDNPAAPTDLANFSAFKLANLAFGDTSADLDLPISSNDTNVYIYITDAGNAASVLYQSGEKAIANYLQQTLIISPNYHAGVSSSYSVFYYQGSRGERWDDQADLKGQLRFYNADFGASVAVTATPAFNPAATVSALADNDASAAITTDANVFYALAANAINVTGLYLFSGELWTTIFYGDGAGADLTAFSVKENSNKVSGAATVTVSDAAYFAANSGANEQFDVFVYLPNQNPQNLSPTFEELTPRMSANTTLYVADGTPTTYRILVTKTGDCAGAGGSCVTYALGTLNVQGNNNYHVMIKGTASTGFKLCQLPDASAAGTCTDL